MRNGSSSATASQHLPAPADISALLRAAHGASPTPIFIGGASRSGTTLLGAMLGVGPDLLTVPESRFKWRLLQLLGPGEDHLPLGTVLDVLRSDWKFPHWDVALAEGRGEPSAAARYDAVLRALALEYGKQRGKPAPQRWIDHTPQNIRYALSLQRLIPDAKFVHIVRDGRAVAASVLPLDWGANGIYEAARYWMSTIALGATAATQLGPQHCVTVRYEDLVTRPEETLQHLCGFCGISYNSNMVDSREYTILPYTAGQHELVGKRPDPTRVQGWRDRLTADQVEAFEYLTGELLGYLGYEMDYGPRARRPSKAFHLRDTAGASLRRKLLDELRRRVRRERGGAPPGNN